YEVMTRDDWVTGLEQSILGKNQIEQIRRTIYEELLFLADVIITFRRDCLTGPPLSSKAAARRAFEYLRAAEKAQQPTHGFYHVRAYGHRVVGQEAAARADEELARKTPPNRAVDYYQQGHAAYNAKKYHEALKSYEASLAVEPTHFWSLWMVGQTQHIIG